MIPLKFRPWLILYMNFQRPGQTTALLSVPGALQVSPQLLSCWIGSLWYGGPSCYLHSPTRTSRARRFLGLNLISLVSPLLCFQLVTDQRKAAKSLIWEGGTRKFWFFSPSQNICLKNDWNYKSISSIVAPNTKMFSQTGNGIAAKIHWELPKVKPRTNLACCSDRQWIHAA